MRYVGHVDGELKIGHVTGEDIPAGRFFGSAVCVRARTHGLCCFVCLGCFYYLTEYGVRMMLEVVTT